MARPLRPRQPGKLRQLDWCLSRYADEAEVDLARVYQVDLVQLVQERRLRFLLNLLLHLPRNSYFQEALSQDDELVEQAWTDDDDSGGPKAPRMYEFTPEVEALYNVIDRLGEVTSAIVGSAGGKPKRIKPMRRPDTAWTRVAHEKRREAHESLVRRVLPNG